MFFLSGGLEVYLGGKTVTAKKGDLVTVNPSTLHSSKITDAPLDYYILIVSDDFLKANSFFCENASFAPLVHSEKVAEIFNEIISESENSDEFSNSAIQGKIIELIVYLKRNFYNSETKPLVKIDKKTEMVKSALEFINKNFKKKLSVDEIANELAFSKSYLSHAFKKVTGYSLITYLNLLKCQSANALITSGYTIKQACLECGFLDVSYFTRTFKKTMGYLPSKTQNTLR